MFAELLTLVIFGIFFLFFALPIITLIVTRFVKIIVQYERGMLFAVGKFAGILEPGVNFVIPFYHRLEKIDMRVTTIDVPKQEVMSKDNVPVNINAVLYFRVFDPEKAILNVEDYTYAISKYAQTSLRNVTGEATLDEMLSERQQIAEKLRKIVDEATDQWGIKVIALELQDIELPEGMKRTMAKQAEAEREKRAAIIKAEGEVAASKNLSDAATILRGVKGALHLRTLHSLNDMSSDQSNTIVFTVPLEVLRALEDVD